MYCVMRASEPSLYNVYRRYDITSTDVMITAVRESEQEVNVTPSDFVCGSQTKYRVAKEPQKEVGGNFLLYTVCTCIKLHCVLQTGVDREFLSGTDMMSC